MRVLWPVLLVLLVSTATADDPTAGRKVLDSLIEIAAVRNPELAAAESMVTSVERRAQAAGSLPDPVLSLGLINLPTNSLSLGETPMSGVGVGLTQKIPWPGKLGDQSNISTLQARRTTQSARQIRERIIRELSTAYYDYSYWQRSDRLLQEYLGLLRAGHDIAETRYANGEISAQAVLRASSMISRTEVRRLKVNQGLLAARLNLRRLVADTTLPDDLPVYLPEPTESSPVIDWRTSSPLVADARLSLEQAEARRSLAGRDYWPDFTVGVDYRFRQNIAGDPADGADFLTFKVGFDIPLWFFARQTHTVAAADYQIEAARAQETAVQDRLRWQIDEAQSMLDLIRESLGTIDTTILPEAQAAHEAAQVAYEVDKIDFDAYLATQTDLYDIRLERLELLRTYNHTRARLAELYGTPEGSPER